MTIPAALPTRQRPRVPDSLPDGPQDETAARIRAAVSGGAGLAAIGFYARIIAGPLPSVSSAADLADLAGVQPRAASRYAGELVRAGQLRRLRTYDTHRWGTGPRIRFTLTAAATR